MSLSQKVALNTIVQVLSKATTVVFGLLTVSLLVNYLGREVFGDYSYVITLVIIFGSFADWGTQTIGVREASRQKQNQGQILANIFLVRLGLAALAAGLMVLAALFLPLKTADPLLLRRVIMVASLLTVMFGVKASFGIIFQTKMVMQKLAAADITISVLIFLLSWYFVAHQAGLATFVLVVILANAVGILIAWRLATKTVRLKFKVDPVFVRRLLGESLPMGALLLVFTIDNKIDTIMLGAIKGSGAVGVYGVAYRIYDVLILGAAYLMNALLPVLSRLENLDRFQKKVQTIYQKTFDVLLIMGGGVMALTIVLAPVVIRLITQQRFGEFVDSVLVMRLLSVAVFLAYFNHLTGYTIGALGHQRRFLWIAGGALVFNVLVNLLVIPRFTYFGAAAVTVLTELLILFVTSIYIYRLIKYAPSLTSFPQTIKGIIKKKGKIF